LPPTPAITLDTASLSATPDDQTFLDSVLSQFFGILTDAAAAIQNFSIVVADKVKASLIATVSLFSKTITLLPQGSLTVPEGENQMAGEGWLNAGATDVFIPNTSVVSSSKIIITPTSPIDTPLAATQKIDGVGFHVGIARASSAPIHFDWLIVQSYSAGPQTQAGQNSGQANEVAPDVAPPDATDVSAPDTSIIDTSNTNDSTDTTITGTEISEAPASESSPPTGDTAATTTSETQTQ